MPRFCILERGWETVGACYGLLLVTLLVFSLLKELSQFTPSRNFLHFLCAVLVKKVEQFLILAFMGGVIILF
jgi:hypothetical protein